MRHRVSGKKLGRDTKHRIALFKNLARALILHGTVTTTEIKGKQLKRLADKLVTTAKPGDMAARRNLHSYFGKRDIVNTLVDRVAPAMTKRTSGFTTIEKVGIRVGDNTQMVTISWVDMPESLGSFANPNPAPKKDKPKAAKPAKAEKKAAPVKKEAEAKPAAKAEKAPAKKVAKKPAAPKVAKKATKK
ncbi:MAG: large subunit ribosomal protein [Patescibacteria group bacterium]|nr:large subunit ribosomal protein [Patescibacteria group bacterium]